MKQIPPHISSIYHSLPVDEGEYALKIVPFSQEEWLSRELVVDSLVKLLGDEAKIQVEMIEEIPVLSSGKRKMVLNEWKR